MFAILLTPAYAPFAIAFVVMMGIGLIEAIGLGLGHLDLDGDMAVDGDSGGVLDWLGLGGELPVLIWLTSLLGCFTLVGIAVQQAATASLGAPLHWSLAAGGAVVVGGLLNTLAANGLARLMPGFETTVISSTDLLRRRGIILEGAARPASKPMENIDTISILDARGLHGDAPGAEASGGGQTNLADAAVAAAMRYRVGGPLIDGLMAELGMTGGSLNGMLSGSGADGALANDASAPSQRKQPAALNGGSVKGDAAA